MSLIEHNPEKNVYILIMIIFSSTTPIGILFGAMLSGVSETVNGVFLSMAAGTFLYLSISEIIPEEFSGECGKKKKKKFWWFAVGVGWMALVLVIEMLS